MRDECICKREHMLGMRKAWWGCVGIWQLDVLPYMCAFVCGKCECVWRIIARVLCGYDKPLWMDIQCSSILKTQQEHVYRWWESVFSGWLLTVWQLNASASDAESSTHRMVDGMDGVERFVALFHGYFRASLYHQHYNISTNKTTQGWFRCRSKDAHKYKDSIIAIADMLTYQGTLQSPW